MRSFLKLISAFGWPPKHSLPLATGCFNLFSDLVGAMVRGGSPHLETAAPRDSQTALIYVV